MKLNVFSIYDVKAIAYATPFFMANDGQAVRAFGDLCEDSKSMVNRHPADFRLYAIGEFDDNSGFLISYDSPKYLSCGSDFIKVNCIKEV